MIESALVAVIVVAAALRAIWLLVPPVRRWFGRGKPASACGCDGCDAGRKPAAPAGPAEQPIRFVRR